MYVVNKLVHVRLGDGRSVVLQPGPRGKGYDGFIEQEVDKDEGLEKALGSKILAELLESGAIEKRED